MLVARRRGASIALCMAFGVLIDAGSASADDKAVCVERHFYAQKLRREGKLRAARVELVACGGESCPAALQKECLTWLAEVDSVMPSVLIEATDQAGKELTDVELRVDGERLASRLDGRAIDVDPGQHTLTFRAPSGALVERRLLLREGERARRIYVRFTARNARSDSPPSREPTGARPWLLPYVLGGVGVAATATFVTFAALGKTKENRLLESCAPTCALGDIGAMRKQYLIADISLGIAALAGGAAVITIVLDRNPTRGAGRARRWVQVTPSAGGAMLGATGLF